MVNIRPVRFPDPLTDQQEGTLSNIRPRYPKYRYKIFVRYEGSGGLIGTEGAKGI